MNDQNAVYGYIRVSTTRQGQQGSSLTEQRDAINRYAIQHSLTIVSWFEEQETAAKRGRRQFSRMLALLKRGKARGVIIHKVDRSARNLKDWADLGELIDAGVVVHFAHESLDLHSRGGRLSADIQAVVAADYIRNLRQEVTKGMRGRLKQGLFPLPAPVGYLDAGKGQPKEPDPETAPLVKRAFQLYATGNYTLTMLGKELHQCGLRNRRGGRVTKTGLSTLLNNPFYIGIIHIKRTGETFSGVHEPLIPKSLFDRVQMVLSGKKIVKIRRHEFLFRRLFRCASCGRSLTGERQKGITYYRCHTSACSRTSVREDVLKSAVIARLATVRFTLDDWHALMDAMKEFRARWESERVEHCSALDLKLRSLQARRERLTDAYLDGVLDRDAYNERRATLLHDIKGVEEAKAVFLTGKRSIPDEVQKFLERAKSLQHSYETGIDDEKRDILGTVTSNLSVCGKEPVVELDSPFQEVANFTNSNYGAAQRDRVRTRAQKLVEFVSKQIDKTRTTEEF